MNTPSLLDGRYQILEEVGGGAMGAVYRALDTRLERTVAIKTIRIDLHSAELADFRRRFEREARATGRLNHPNIVIVHDSGVSGSVAFIAMEFLSGTPLDALLRGRGALSVAEALAIVAPIALALDYAHAEGVIHRDVKPGNIIRLENGLIKLTDFGIAQTPNADFTQTGVVLGTPKYMAPEQIAGLRVDGRADIFSLGGVLYELVTGRAPFSAPTLVSLMHTVLHTPPDPVERWVASAPRALAAILARCLAKDPAQRYARASELAEDLRSYPDVAIDEGLIARVFGAVRATEPGAGLVPLDTRAAARTLRLAALAHPRSLVARLSHLPRWRYATAAVGGLLALAALGAVVGPRLWTPAPTLAPAAATAPEPASTTVLPPAAVTVPTATVPTATDAAAGATAAAPQASVAAEPTAPAPQASVAAEPPVAVRAAPRKAHPGTGKGRTSQVASSKSTHGSPSSPDGASAAGDSQDSLGGLVTTEWRKVRHGVVDFYDEQRDCIRFNRCQPPPPSSHEATGQR